MSCESLIRAVSIPEIKCTLHAFFDVFRKKNPIKKPEITCSIHLVIRIGCDPKQVLSQRDNAE